MKFIVAKLKKNSEKFEILVENGGNKSDVKTILERGDGTIREFKKGSRSSLFSAIDLARKTNSQLIKEGWESVETNFSSVAQSLYNQELGVETVVEKPVKSDKLSVKKSKPKPPSIKKLLSMNPAGLGSLAKEDLMKAVEVKKAKKVEKSA